MAKYSPEVWKNLLFANANSYIEQHNGDTMFASLFILGTTNTKMEYLMEVSTYNANSAMCFFAMMASLLFLENEDCEIHGDFMKDDQEMIKLAEIMTSYLPNDLNFSMADGGAIFREVWMKKDGAMKMLPYISGYIMNHM